MYILGPLLVLVCVIKGKRALLYGALLVGIIVLVGWAVVAFLPIWIVGLLLAHFKETIVRFSMKVSPLTLRLIRLGALGLTFAVAVGGANDSVVATVAFRLHAHCPVRRAGGYAHSCPGGRFEESHS